MEATFSQSLQIATCINSEKIAGKQGGLQFSRNSWWEKQGYRVQISCYVPSSKGRKPHSPITKVSWSSKKLAASVLESGSPITTLDETKILKNKSEEVEPYLNGRCIYLVGMMGSGKTTVGKVLSEALGYSFCDCDTLIEEAVGGTTVAEIFKVHGENFFRDNETEVLRQLSTSHRLVVSTGGGAVVRPINWRYMQKGISIWLDVPLEALARRITAVGTKSRPLLHNESGDPYIKTMKRLSALFEERGEAYANSDARVSFENIAAKMGVTDVCDITPTEIAIEALVQIQNFLKN